MRNNEKNLIGSLEKEDEINILISQKWIVKCITTSNISQANILHVVKAGLPCW